MTARNAQPLRVTIVALSARTGGGGTHLTSQAVALAARDGLEVTVHASTELADRLRAAEGALRVVEHPRYPLARRLVVEQILLLRQYRASDVVFLPGNTGLLFSRVPQVICQQNAWYFTDEVRAFRRRRCSRRMRARLAVESAMARLSIRRADRVIMVSESLLRAVEADLGAVPNARVILSAPPSQPVVGQSVPSDGPYVLAVAPDDPHKDLDGLVSAWRRHADLPPLVIVGRSSDERRAALTRDTADRVRMEGQVEDRARLAALYAGASCVVAHSWFESFGLTPAESLRSGTAVAATDLPAHREVCGDAAVYYAPGDPDALAAAVRTAVAAGPPRPGARGPVLERSWDENAAELALELAAAAGRSGLVLDALAARYGGAAYATVAIAKQLAGDPAVGIVTVVTRRGSIVADGLVGVGGIRLVTLPATAGPLELVHRMIWQAVSLPRLMKRNQALLTWSAMLPRSIRGRVVCLIANPLTFLDRGLGHAIRRAGTTRTARSGAIVVAPSAAMADLVETRLGRRPVVVPLGAGEAATRPDGAPGDELLYVGDLYPHKRHDLALAAWAALPEPRPPLQLVGDSRVDPAHTRRVLGWIEAHRAHGPIRLSSQVSAAELAAHYRRARVLLLTSERESFAMPLLEALVTGVPAVVRDLPALRDTGGEATVFVHGDDPRAWAEAIERVWNDGEAHARMREAGFAHARQFSWERTAAALRDLALGP